MTTIDLLNEVLKDPMLEINITFLTRIWLTYHLIRPRIIGLLRW